MNQLRIGNNARKLIVHKNTPVRKIKKNSNLLKLFLSPIFPKLVANIVMQQCYQLSLQTTVVLQIQCRTEAKHQNWLLKHSTPNNSLGARRGPVKKFPILEFFLYEPYPIPATHQRQKNGTKISHK